MINILKLGHAEFEARDLPALAAYYCEVMGLTVTEREPRAVYLTSTIEHHSVVLRSGHQDRLVKIAFEVTPGDAGDVAGHLKSRGLTAEVLGDPGPGIKKAVRTADPDGFAVELYSEPAIEHRPYSFNGIMPFKLGHIAIFTTDIEKSVAFYREALGLRFSDSMKTFFYFLRCGADHHTFNILPGERSAMNHLAFALNDMAHVRTACDVLHRHKIPVLWGPLRHGIGHNIAMYHKNVAGQIIEVYTELDTMSNEGLGYFDPRPWHDDLPHRPKEWEDVPNGTNLWGYPPPEEFLAGTGKEALSMGGKPE